MKASTMRSWTTLATLAALPTSHGYGAGDADYMFNAMNDAFLRRFGSTAYYLYYANGTSHDKGWTLSQDIFVPEDVWLRTGSPDTAVLVDNLVSFFLANRPVSAWYGDLYNDDIGWFTEGLIRGYQVTGNTSFIEPARNGSDFVFNRGWNTSQIGGDIWETQPEANHTLVKLDLSTNSNAYVACLIYQSTHEVKYLERCELIYNWTRTHLFQSNGALWSGEYPDGTFDKGTPLYDQGLFVDLANILWLITGNATYYNDAKLAMDYGWNNLTKTSGIFSNSDPIQNGWADDFGRGAGNFVRDNQLWDDYYDKFVVNANAILANRLTTFNITWNGWAQQTPAFPDGNITLGHFTSAVTWLQYVPPYNPSNETRGIRTLTNAGNNLLIQSSGTFGAGQPVVLHANTSTQAQRWLLTTNEADNNTYNLQNMDSWQALTADSTSATALSQNVAIRQDNQRWVITSVGSGLYSIINKKTQLALDGGSPKSTTLSQTKYTGTASQKWRIDALPVPSST